MSYFLAVIGAREICVSTIVVLGYDRFRKQSSIVVYVVGSLKPFSSPLAMYDCYTDCSKCP